MPKKYIRMTENKYSLKDLENAGKAIKEGRTYREVAELYGVPRSVI